MVGRPAPPALCARALALAALAALPAADALRGWAPEVVVVQGTNRPLPQLESLDGRYLAEADSPQGVLSDWLGALHVAEYARRHGYAYRMYLYNDSYKGACWHPARGPIWAQWCKIAALRLAYEQYPESRTFVWLDTDVTVVKPDVRVEEHLRAAPLLKYNYTTEEHPQCPSGEPAQGRQGFKIWSSRNAHWPHWDGSCGPNSGIMVFRRSDFTRRFLDGWWESAMKPGVIGPYDQGYVALMQMKYPEEMVVMKEDAMSGDKALLAMHRCRKCVWMPNRTALFLALRPASLDVRGANAALRRLWKGVDTKIRDRTPGGA